MKIEIKWDKTRLVSYLGRLLRRERENKRKRRRGREEEEEEEKRYGNYFCMDLYGFLDCCMDISLFHF